MPQDQYVTLVPCVRELIAYHRIIEELRSIPVDVSALERFCAKLELDSPIFENDLTAVRHSIASCKRQLGYLRNSDAHYLLKIKTARRHLAAQNKDANPT